MLLMLFFALLSIVIGLSYKVEKEVNKGLVKLISTKSFLPKVIIVTRKFKLSITKKPSVFRIRDNLRYYPLSYDII